MAHKQSMRNIQFIQSYNGGGIYKTRSGAYQFLKGGKLKGVYPNILALTTAQPNKESNGQTRSQAQQATGRNNQDRSRKSNETPQQTKKATGQDPTA